MRLQLQSWGSQKQCKHRDLESLVKQLQRASTSPVQNASKSFNFAFGHSHEPNAIETVLNTMPQLMYPSSHSIYSLRRLPPQMQCFLDVAKLPLIGASPDGLLFIDTAFTGSNLELKCRMLFYQNKKGS